MEKRIQLEKRGRNPNQIQELNLDNCRSTNIVGLTDEFTALESLSLINVGLTTLKGFPKLPNLKKLELSDNRISNGLNYLTTSPKLTNLNLSGNKIKDLETLKPLENFQNLEVLDLFNNEATSVENYREKTFAMIPSLKYLDGFDANEVEAPSDGDHDSEDDDVAATGAFSINGLEIDLAELEDFEKRLKEKRSVSARIVPVSNEPDDLDELLEKLKLQEANSNPDADRNQSCPTNAVINSAIINDASCSSSQAVVNSTVDFDKNEQITLIENSDSDQIEHQRPINITLMMFGLMLIMSLVNYVVFSEEGDEDDEGDDDDDDDDDDSDEEDNGDVSLAEVYNDDLEEDNSDWGEENEAEEEDDDPDTDSEAEEGDEAATAATAAVAKDENQTEAEVPEDPQARGKKRKHEG